MLTYIGFDPIGFDWLILLIDYTTSALSQQIKFTLLGHLFTYLKFLVGSSVTFIPGFVMFIE